MTIISQLKEKALFTESGSLLCIEKNRDDLADAESGLFTNGKFSGDVNTFPYAIVFRSNSAVSPILMGVYETYSAAEDAFFSALHSEKFAKK